MVLVLCSYHISIAQQVDAVSVEMKWKAIWSTSQGLNWEIQELKSVTVFFWSTLKSQPGLEAVMVPRVQGAGQTTGKQCGAPSASNLRKSFWLLKTLDFFFSFPDIRDLQNFPLPAVFWPLPQATHALAARSRTAPLGTVGSDRNCISLSTKLCDFRPSFPSVWGRKQETIRNW